jgi:hypothetical protein
MEAAPFQDEILTRWAIVTAMRQSWIVYKDEPNPESRMIEQRHDDFVVDEDGKWDTKIKVVRVETKNRPTTFTQADIDIDDVYRVTDHGEEKFLSMKEPFQDFMGGWDDLSSKEFIDTYYRKRRDHPLFGGKSFSELSTGKAHEVARKDAMWGVYYHAMHQDDNMFPFEFGNRNKQWQRVLDLVNELESYDYIVANDEEATKIELFKLWWRITDECENMC